MTLFRDTTATVVLENENHGAFIVDDNHNTLCDFYFMSGDNNAHNHGLDADVNAERFAACWNGCQGINPEAVPDLLAACEAYADAFDAATGTVYVNKQIRAAIAKALETSAKERG
jgi:hypothetical protein